MKTKAMRLHGKKDLRIDEFELPAMKDDEILARVVSDSVCMSSYKAAIQGSDHKRVPANIDTNPIIIGHEFCGEILEVGSKWSGDFKPGQKFILQAALNLPDRPYDAPGYSFEFVGGAATHIIIPSCVMEQGCLLPYNGEAFFFGSLAEPVSCIIGGYHVNYHTTNGVYEHRMGIVPGGNAALFGAAGPMGLGAIDYAIHCDRRPGLLVVTDIDQSRLDRAASIYSVEEAAKNGVRLVYLNTGGLADPVASMREMTGGKGFDDVFVYAPVKVLVEQADAILGHDGCLNFFAGPTDTQFSSNFNFYNVHYLATHVCGNSGGNTDDMKEALEMMSAGNLNPSSMITHICGLDSAPEVTLNQPNIKGGKKLVYTGIRLPLVAIDELAELGRTDPLMAELAAVVAENKGLWCAAAEKILLEKAEAI